MLQQQKAELFGARGAAVFSFFAHNLDLCEKPHEQLQQGTRPVGSEDFLGIYFSESEDENWETFKLNNFL